MTGKDSTRRQFLKSGSLLGIAGIGVSSSPGLEAESQVRAVGTGAPSKGAIILENREFSLRISADGRAESLLHKASGQECLVQGTNTPMFVLTQYRPYNNELQLRFPAKKKGFPAKSVEQQGSRLRIRFEMLDLVVTVNTKITDSYIAFQVDTIEQDLTGSLRSGRKYPADELWIAQLPVRTRANFGEWLNVMWDDQVAVNLLGTDPYAHIESEERPGYWLMQGGTADEVKQEGVGVALIVCRTGELMNRIDRIEQDYGLPRGVQSRKRPEYPYSYFWVSDINPENADEYIRFAKQGGFRTFTLYYTTFAKAPGHYLFRDDYPNGMQDLKSIVGKIHAAGMLAGLHFHYNKTFGLDPYVTPRPDPRLNLRRQYTLSAPLDTASTTVDVEENPNGCREHSAEPYLRIEDELVSYGGYTTERPYRFTGCKRGIFGTVVRPHPSGIKLGLLGEVAGVIGVYDQRTSIQEEVAQRLAGIYDEAGFDYAYFDGAEDVPPPYWFNVSWAQWLTYKAFRNKPLFSEGACKSHFSWHILTRGNAFDVFEPEVLKAAVREHPGEEAPRIAKDFTGLDFGWTGYVVPTADRIGTQPDMLEFNTSRAAAWDCPFSFRPGLDELARHPRTADNMEVVRRWEEVRVRRWLTPAQKNALRNLEQEHILLINEKGEFELVPYWEIERAASGNPLVHAFVFERQSRVYVVFWHRLGEGKLRIPVPKSAVRLFADLGKPEIPVEQSGPEVVVPIGARAYLEFTGRPRPSVIKSIQESGSDHDKIL
jgi:hypothetical protein